MTAFAGALDALFADLNQAVDAVYRVGGLGSGVAVRALMSLEDETASLGTTGAQVRQQTAELRASELVAAGIAAPVAGDTLETGGVLYAVKRPWQPDADRLLWKLALRPG